jgi:hypothetical protein
VIKDHALAEIDNTLKAKIRCIYKLSTRGLVRQDIAEIIRGIEEAFNVAKGTTEEMISLIQFNGRPALGTSLLYS